MKKIFLALLCLLMVSVSLAYADREVTYVVRKGDTLSTICWERGLKNWEATARYNQLEYPYTIYPDQEIILYLPDDRQGMKRSSWRNKGADPALKQGFSIKDSATMAKILEMIDKFQKMPEALKWQFKNALATTNPTEAQISVGEVREEMHFGSQLKYNGIKVVPDPKEPNRGSWPVLRWSKMYDGKMVVVDIPDCGNVSWGYLEQGEQSTGDEIVIFSDSKKTAKSPESSNGDEKSEAPAKEEKKQVPRKVVIGKPVSGVDRFPKIEFVEEVEGDHINLTGFDAVAGIDFYRDSLSDADHDGKVVFIKPRWRFWEFESDGDQYGLGLMGQYAFGDGNDNGWKYDWYEVILGATIKGFMNENWDFDLDIGIGYGENEGGKGLVTSDQNNLFAYLGAHANIQKPYGDHGNWWSKLELDLQLKHQFDADHHVYWKGQEVDGDAWDNSIIEVSAKQKIYDFWITESTKVSPTWLLTLGHNFGHEKSFFRTGPGATLSLYDQDVLSIYLFHYQAWLDGGGDQWHLFAAMIDVGASIKARKMSQISEATDDDVSARLDKTSDIDIEARLKT